MRVLNEHTLKEFNILERTDVRGFVAMGDHQCGDEGPKGVTPGASRDIGTVCGFASASVRPFLSYFDLEGVLEVLIKERLKGKDAGGMLPPRKMWSRGGLRERVCKDSQGRKIRRDPKDIRRESIRRRVLKMWREGTLGGQPWGAKLLAFRDELERKARNGEVRFSAPEMLRIAKGMKDGKKEFRQVAKFNELSDRVCLAVTTRYLRDWLEGVLTDDCYSFRKDPDVDHECAVEALKRWRERHDGEAMFVAECDIRKFFDSIPHETVRRRWTELSVRLGLEPAAREVVEAYLDVYSYDGGCSVGLPQGGSLSTVLANLVLCEADDRVRTAGGDGLFYARYCDDVVFAHADEAECRAAMQRYEEALTALGLPMHPRGDFIYRPVDMRSGTEYFRIKTKGPFRWAEAESGAVNVAPWVSFVGSQIRYDGETRIRKESIRKHVRSLGHETSEAIRELEHPGFSEPPLKWYSRFRNRLIRKGVGYVTAKLKDCDKCWAAAFGEVTECGDTQREMRYLDRIREKMLAKVAAVLRSRGVEVKKGHRFKGHPFSYDNFLMKAKERPTNMHRRRRARIGYSEL